MAYLTNEQILQQNGNLSTDDWIIKATSQPDFLGRRYLLPSIQTNIMRQAVLGYYMESCKMIAPANTIELILMPAAEARAGLGMYGKGDVNYSTQVNNGHIQGEIQNIINNQPIKVGERVEQWDTIGNDKINFKLKSQISVTKKFISYTLRNSDIPQAIQVALQNIMQTITQAYEDIFLLELMSIGVNANDEILNGDVNRPVCKFVADPTSPVDVNFNQGTDKKNNAFVQLINNVNTYAAEIGLQGISTELIVSPMFVNNLKNSANWVFNNYANVQQTQEMRTGIVGEILNGMRVFQAPRLSARYGNVLLNGLKCPDFLLVDRSAVLIPTLIVESLHMEPAPSDYFQCILIKALEIFGVYARPLTIEDYQAQLNGFVRSSGVLYGYLFTNPSVIASATSTFTITPSGTVFNKGLNTITLTTAMTNTTAVSGSKVGTKLQGVQVFLDSAYTKEVKPDGIRAFTQGDQTASSATSATGTLQLGVVSDYYSVDNIYVKLNFVCENTVATTAKIIKLKKVTVGNFITWQVDSYV